MTNEVLRKIVHNVWDRHCDERDMDCVAVLGWNKENKVWYSFFVGRDPEFLKDLEKVFPQSSTNWKENSEEEIEWEQ